MVLYLLVQIVINGVVVKMKKIFYIKTLNNEYAYLTIYRLRLYRMYRFFKNYKIPIKIGYYTNNI